MFVLVPPATLAIASHLRKPLLLQVLFGLLWPSDIFCGAPMIKLQRGLSR